MQHVTMHAVTGSASREEAGTLLPVLIGAFLAARVAITLICVRWLGLDAQAGAGAGILTGALLFVLACFHSLGAAIVPARAMLRLSPVRWVFLFLLVSALSFAWSGAVSPASSFAYWCALAADVATILVLLRGGPILHTAHALLRGYIYAASALAVLAWMLPVQSDLRLGDMDYFNTNQIGNLCAFAFFLAQYLERAGTQKWTATKAFLLITLVRSLSKTTLAAMLVSQGFLFLWDSSVSRRKKAWIAIGAIAAVALSWGLFQAYFEIYTTAGKQAETLTGRTAIWAYALDAALARPWIGNGFDALWKVIPPIGPDRFEARHAENELLQQFFAYGALGLVLITGLYGSLFRQMRRLASRPQRMILFSLMLFILVRGLAEAEPFDLILPLWSIVLFSVLAACESLVQQPGAGIPLARIPSPAEST